MTLERPSHRAIATVFCLATMWGMVPGCAGELAGDPEEYRVGVANAEVGCDRAIEIFEESCTSCHNADDEYGGLDLTGPGLAARLVDRPSSDMACGARRLVDSESPEESFLLEKVASTSPECGDPMPLGGRLPTEDVECVQAWIASLVQTADAGAEDAAAAASSDAGEEAP